MNKRNAKPFYVRGRAMILLTPKERQLAVSALRRLMWSAQNSGAPVLRNASERLMLKVAAAKIV